EEANLANNISILRRTLSQNGERFIETAPKRGYRFVADVKESEARDYAVAGSRRMESSAVVVEEARMRVTPTVKSFAGNLLSRAARHKAAMAILLVFIIGLVLFRPRVLNQVNSRPAAPFQKMESNAITRTGNAKDVAISPDGQYIGYVTDSDGLWLKNLVANNSQQIIPPVNAKYYGLSFSHDGRYLYFVWAEHRNSPLRALYRIPIMGGTPTRLLIDIDHVPGFSPDNTRIVFHRLSLSANESYLMIANADGSGEYKLATRPLSERFRFHAWSPDSISHCRTVRRARLPTTRIIITL